MQVFQHTAARRRLGGKGCNVASDGWVSTHSRPKAAGVELDEPVEPTVVSTHSRPKAAGFRGNKARASIPVFQHTAARRRLEKS